MKFENVTKIILATLFFLCLFDMPYGFYQLVRFLALIGFALLAFKSYERQENKMLIIYCGLAVLFQPFFKIALGREIWNIVDVVVGLALITSIWVPVRNGKQF